MALSTVPQEAKHLRQHDRHNGEISDAVGGTGCRPNGATDGREEEDGGTAAADAAKVGLRTHCICSSKEKCETDS